MELSRDTRQELRDMGWTVVRPKAQRPPAIRTRDVLHVGDDIRIEGDAEARLCELDSHV